MPCSRSLVGIAGEDDVDAPDLLPPEQQTPKPNEPQGGGNSRLNGGHLHAPLRAAGPRDGKFQSNPTEAVLGPGAWAALRDRLLGELNELASGDEAALWAHRSLQDKNKLIAADAHPGEDEPHAPGNPHRSLVRTAPIYAQDPLKFLREKPTRIQAFHCNKHLLRKYANFIRRIIRWPRNQSVAPGQPMMFAR